MGSQKLGEGRFLVMKRRRTPDAEGAETFQRGQFGKEVGWKAENVRSHEKGPVNTGKFGKVKT